MWMTLFTDGDSDSVHWLVAGQKQGQSKVTTQMSPPICQLSLFQVFVQVKEGFFFYLHVRIWTTYCCRAIWHTTENYTQQLAIKKKWGQNKKQQDRTYP